MTSRAKGLRKRCCRMVILAHKKQPNNMIPASEVFYEALGSDYFDVAARGTASSGIQYGGLTAGTVNLL